MTSSQTTDTVKHVVDAAAAATAVGTIVQVLPAIAAGFTILWMMIRIWETETVRKWTKRLPS